MTPLFQRRCVAARKRPTIQFVIVKLSVAALTSINNASEARRRSSRAEMSNANRMLRQPGRYVSGRIPQNMDVDVVIASTQKTTAASLSCSASLSTPYNAAMIAAQINATQMRTAINGPAPVAISRTFTSELAVIENRGCSWLDRRLSLWRSTILRYMRGVSASNQVLPVFQSMIDESSSVDPRNDAKATIVINSRTSTTSVI